MSVPTFIVPSSVVAATQGAAESVVHAAREVHQPDSYLTRMTSLLIKFVQGVEHLLNSQGKDDSY